MFSIALDYPTFDEEIQVVKATTTGRTVELNKRLTATEILYFQQLMRKIPVADNVLEYAVRLATKTRPNRPDSLTSVNNYIAWGAGSESITVFSAGC
jgi:MoxR-like ATPase